MNPREELEAEASEQRTRADRITDELYRWRWWLFGAAVVLGGYAYWRGLELTVPRWVKIVGLSAAVVGVVALPYAARLVQWLYNPNNPHIVNIEADGNGLEVWELPPDVWRELDVEDDELHSLRALFPTWEARDYDPEENVAVGSWRAGATDLELVVQQGKARSVQGQFEELAREGLGYRAQYTPAVAAAVREIVLESIGAFEGEALYDGHAVREAVERELDEFLERERERAADSNEAVGDDRTDAEVNDGVTIEWTGQTSNGEGEGVTAPDA